MDATGGVSREKDPLLLAARGLVFVAVISVAGAVALILSDKEATLLASFGSGAIGALATLIRGGREEPR